MIHVEKGIPMIFFVVILALILFQRLSETQPPTSLTVSFVLIHFNFKVFACVIMHCVSAKTTTSKSSNGPYNTNVLDTSIPR